MIQGSPGHPPTELPRQSGSEHQRGLEGRRVVDSQVASQPPRRMG